MQMEKFTLALSRFRRNKYDNCIILCDELLKNTPDDLAVQLLKTHAIRKKNSIDDLEFDEEGLGDIILNDNKLTSVARPGTSISRPGTGKSASPLVRPVSSSGRPISGVVRPQSNRRQGTASGSNQINRQTANRSTTARAVTSGGRYLRLATASLQSLNSSTAINLADINPKNIVRKKSLSKAVADYLYYVVKDFKKMLEIASEATSYNNYNDWWWKYQLAKVYYKLGMLGDSEKQLISGLKLYPSFTNAILLLSHVYTKMDQPLRALELLNKASAGNPGDMYFTIYQARIQEMLGDFEASVSFYKSVLLLNNCNFEAIACIGSHHFYSDQPEIAMKFYKRLFELGIHSPEIWNNLGLCAYYSGQYDFCLSCFERALLASDSDEMAADIWYNISNIAISIGDLHLAYQALKISITYNGMQFEAFNNLAVLEIKKNNNEQAKSNFLLSCQITDYSFEPYYNYAAMKYKQGDYEEAQKYVKKSLDIFPEHFDSKELGIKIKKELFS